jgi:hypothetical protein
MNEFIPFRFLLSLKEYISAPSDNLDKNQILKYSAPTRKVMILSQQNQSQN